MRVTLRCWSSLKPVCPAPSCSLAQEILVDWCWPTTHSSVLCLGTPQRACRASTACKFLKGDFSTDLVKNFPWKASFQEKLDFYPKYTFPRIRSPQKLWCLSGRAVLEKQNVLFAAWFLTYTHFLYNEILFSVHLCHRQLKNNLMLNSQQRPNPVPNLSSAQMQCWIKPTVIFWEVKEKKSNLTHPIPSICIQQH